MKDYNTIIGIIDMRQRSISYDDCRSRFHCGNNAITLIMRRFQEIGLDLNTLRKMEPEKVEQMFYPPENIRRKDISLMPDFQAVYDRLKAPKSRANLFYLWLKYKQGYNLREISKMLNISLPWAQKIDQRAKKRLEELYKERGGIL